MRTPAPEAIALAGVFALALIGPWDTSWGTTSSGDSGFYLAVYLALGLLCGTAFFVGRRGSWGESLVIGAGVGFFGVAFYMIGSAIAYDLGWWGRSCDHSEDCDYTFLGSILPATMLYGLPFAVICAILASIGHAILGPHWRRAGL